MPLPVATGKVSNQLITLPVCICRAPGDDVQVPVPRVDADVDAAGVGQQPHLHLVEAVARLIMVWAVGFWSDN